MSLWAYGCGGQGSVRRQSTRRIDLRYYYDELPNEMGKHLLSLTEWIIQIKADLAKPIHAWRASYSDSSDPYAFREWLKLILDSRRSLDIGEGYGFSPVSKSFGLLTYRYLKLFTKLGRHLYTDNRLASVDGISETWDSEHIVNYLIRNECLEEDLIIALEKADYRLTRAQINSLMAAKNNKSNMSIRESSEYYYDKDCLELVAHKESFIIKKHQYTPPVLS